ncbi:MAG: hypothetical protein ACRDPM_19905 [Solirubrobacteraceae bacterium]
MRVGAGAAAGLLVTLALAACGTGGTKASSSATTSFPPVSTGAASPDTGTTTSGTGTSDPTTASSQTTAATTSTSSSPQRGRHGHGHGHGQGNNGLPAAPAGLAQTTGYATYERCQGTCTGAVPAALRRPLTLPSDDSGPCPITINAQPVSPRELPAGVGFRRIRGSQWLIAEVTWTVPGSYAGPVLIRGEMLGGGGPLGFGTGADPYDELQLLGAGQGAPRVAGGGRAWITYARIRSAGCYAYQVDGNSFAEEVVFRAVA